MLVTVPRKCFGMRKAYHRFVPAAFYAWVIIITALYLYQFADLIQVIVGQLVRNG